MTNADTNIAALRSGYDTLAELVTKLGDDDLAGPSGAAEWDVSQVLSHLGSGAEIGQATLQAALDGNPNPGSDFNHGVWDRWNAMSGRERADGFQRANESLIGLFESLDAGTRESLRVDLGFLPAPVDVATAARMRLSEFALHSWDVRVAVDPAATIAPEAVGSLLQGSPDLLGWLGKTEPLNGAHAVLAVTTSHPDSVFTLHLTDGVRMTFDVPEQPDGTLTLPAEAWLRLAAGRLSPQHTPAGVATTGPVDLDLLRRIFPGY